MEQRSETSPVRLEKRERKSCMSQILQGLDSLARNGEAVSGAMEKPRRLVSRLKDMEYELFQTSSVRGRVGIQTQAHLTVEPALVTVTT